MGGHTNMLQQQSRATNTNSLESIDSNPRQAVAKSYEKRGDPQAAMRVMRAAASHGHPRRPPLPVPVANSPQDLSTSPPSNTAHPGLSGGHRPHPPPPPHHPLASLQGSGGPPPVHHYPPHIPLPGLTCQLSLVPHPTGEPTSSSSGPTSAAGHPSATAS